MDTVLSAQRGRDEPPGPVTPGACRSALVVDRLVRPGSVKTPELNWDAGGEHFESPESSFWVRMSSAAVESELNQSLNLAEHATQRYSPPTQRILPAQSINLESFRCMHLRFLFLR